MKRFLAVFFLCLAAAHTAWPKGAANGIEIRDAWAVPTVGERRIGVAYLTLANESGQMLALRAIRSPLAATVELHENMRDGDIFRMRKVKNPVILPGEALEMKPGGLHLMLMGLRQPLKEGEALVLTFEFEGGLRREVRIPVTAPKP